MKGKRRLRNKNEIQSRLFFLCFVELLILYANFFGLFLCVFVFSQFFMYFGWPVSIIPVTLCACVCVCVSLCVFCLFQCLALHGMFFFFLEQMHLEPNFSQSSRRKGECEIKRKNTKKRETQEKKEKK